MKIRALFLFVCLICFASSVVTGQQPVKHKKYKSPNALPFGTFVKLKKLGVPNHVFYAYNAMHQVARQAAKYDNNFVIIREVKADYDVMLNLMPDSKAVLDTKLKNDVFDIARDSIKCLLAMEAAVDELLSLYEEHGVDTETGHWCDKTNLIKLKAKIKQDVFSLRVFLGEII